MRAAVAVGEHKHMCVCVRACVRASGGHGRVRLHMG
jgi:hypothetical protein